MKYPNVQVGGDSGDGAASAIFDLPKVLRRGVANCSGDVFGPEDRPNSAGGLYCL